MNLLKLSTFLRKFPFIFSFGKQVYIFIKRIVEFFSVLVTSPQLGLLMLRSYIERGLFRRYKEITINSGGYSFLVPNEPRLFIVFNEIFNEESYSKLDGLDGVLDLGGFMGESAVYFSSKNKKVIVYEADTENYRFLSKNVVNIKNIVPYNMAVVGDNSISQITLHKNEKFAIGATVNSGTQGQYSYDVPAVFIGEVMQQNNIDGLKMDIEGSEYGILEYLMKNDLFTFQKGYIEFHLFEERAERKEKIKTFFQFLNDRGFRYQIFHGFTVKEIPQDKILGEIDKGLFIFILYFEKIS